MKAILFFLILVAFASLGQSETTPAAERSAEEEAVHKAVDQIVAAIDRLLMANARIAERNGDLPYFGL